MNPNPELEKAFDEVKEKLHQRGLTPRHPLKLKVNDIMATEKAATKTAKEKPAKADGPAYTSAMFAKDLGLSPVELRKALRGIGAKRPDGGRWGWPSKSAADDLKTKINDWVSTDGRADNTGRPKAAKAKKAASGKAPVKTGTVPAKKASAKKVTATKLKKKAAA